MSLKIKLSDIAYGVWEFALDVFYPKKCVLCNSFVNYGKKISLCTECSKKLRWHSGVIRLPDSYFEEVVYAFNYDGYIKEAVTDTKFRNIKYLSKAFGYAMYTAVKDREFIKDVSFICCVPLNPLRKRDYNQSAVIAKAFSDYTSIEMYEDVIIKSVNLPPLSKMNYCKRDYVVKNAFSFNYGFDVSDKTVCLIDDIYTTGSTVNECARLLKMYGAKKVYVLTACCAGQKERRKTDNADSDITNK